MTGFGSELNDWTNISEVRWSLTGYEVQGEKVSIFNDHVTFGDSSGAFNTIADTLWSVSSFPYRQCDVQSGTLIDSTGYLDSFHSMTVVNGLDMHFIDWDHYPVGVFNGIGSWPETYSVLAAANASAFLQNQTQESSCLSSGLKDMLWRLDEAVEEARQ